MTKTNKNIAGNFLMLGAVFILTAIVMSGAAYANDNSFIDFDGQNDFLSVHDSSSLDGLEEASWSLWVKQKKIKDTVLMDKNGSYTIRTNLADGIAVTLADNEKAETAASQPSKSCGIRANNEWTLLTITYNGTSIKYYRNGALCDTQSTGVRGIANSDSDLHIGGSSGQFFNGSMSDVRIYSRELKKEQVSRLYEEGEFGLNRGISIPTLVYHKIRSDGSGASDEVTLDEFEKQVDFLSSQGFNTITDKQFDAWRHGNFELPEKPVMLDFDDGWNSVYELAEPAMSKHDYTGTMHIVTYYADGNSGSSYMNWVRIQALQERGWDAQSHGVNHIRMSELNETEFRRQLNESKEKIGNRTGEEPISFVFPFYAANEEYTAICGEYYNLCWTWAASYSTPRYNFKSNNGKVYQGLMRISVTPGISQEDFRDIFGKDSNIAAQWKMSEGSEDKVFDSSSNSNDATFNGNVTFQEEPGAQDGPPVIFVPGDLSAEAESRDGTKVNFKVNATDKVDGKIVPKCSHNSGEVFPIGKTNVECTASDSKGNNASASFDITVKDSKAPLLQFQPNLIFSMENETEINFTASVSDLASDIESIKWDFGDGSSASGENASHKYDDEGTYKIKLTVKDSSGNEARQEGLVIIGNESKIMNLTSNAWPNLILSFGELPEGSFTFQANESANSSTSIAGFQSAGRFFDITSNLGNGAFNLTLYFKYNDSNNDGIVDSSNISEGNLSVYFYDTGSNSWKAIENATRNAGSNLISVRVDHFTLFGLLAPGSNAQETGNSGNTGNTGNSESSSSSGSAGGAASSLVESESSTVPQNTTNSSNGSSGTNIFRVVDSQRNDTVNITSDGSGKNESEMQKGMAGITGAVIGGIGRSWLLIMMVLIGAGLIIALLVNYKESRIEKRVNNFSS